ncbi:MAG TPA: UvrD-helicase domain-containing protein [Candidatus Babeliales bacterium]|nr:UvrD-helicase domain-containing protein [Candidatus Babeliales bacterium]
MAAVNFQEFLSQQLNPAQAAAVTTTKGVLLIIAGAGSGKTRVITARIANLILNEQVSANSILALTFTNKAAQEMRERVTHFLTQELPEFNINNPDSRTILPFVGTFHAYCLQLLKKHAHLLATPNFTILDSEDQEKLMSRILKTHNLQKTLNNHTALYSISQLKNNPTKFQDAQNSNLNTPHNSQRYKLLQELLQIYETEKRISHCLDFDDLLLETLKLFDNPEFKQNFQHRIKHILIDEYQDTSLVQHQLLQKMALNPVGEIAADSICIVGDEDQSIYSWRGATVDNIVNFRHEFQDTKVIKIEQNYRSVAPILAVANSVIKHNQNRNPKNLWSTRTAQERVFKATCLSSQREAELITNLVRENYTKNSSIAVLYRTHSQSRAIEEALIKNNLPYQIIGGIRFYERKEIKDLLAYLKLLVNPFDRISLERIINCPPRKLGEKFWDLLIEKWQTEPLLNFKELIQLLLKSGELTNQRQTALTDFLNLFNNLNSSSQPSSAIAIFVNQIGYYSYLKDSYETREADDKANNIKELIRAAEFFEHQAVTKSTGSTSSDSKLASVLTFLEEIALLQEKLHNNDQAKTQQVALMTLHAAKGLEFDTVVIAGLEEGLLPSTRSLNDPSAIEEERRLFYVGITRAREKLILTHCLYRYLYGQTNESVISRFLKEIPVSLYQDYAQPEHVMQYLGAHKTNLQASKNYYSETYIPKNSNNNLVSETKNLQPQNPVLFKLYTPVQHSKFGIGLVQKCEQRGSQQVSVTVKFKSGVTKEIDAKFLTKI